METEPADPVWVGLFFISSGAPNYRLDCRITTALQILGVRKSKEGNKADNYNCCHELPRLNLDCCFWKLSLLMKAAQAPILSGNHLSPFTLVKGDAP